MRCWRRGIENAKILSFRWYRKHSVSYGVHRFTFKNSHQLRHQRRSRYVRHVRVEMQGWNRDKGQQINVFQFVFTNPTHLKEWRTGFRERVRTFIPIAKSYKNKNENVSFLSVYRRKLISANTTSWVPNWSNLNFSNFIFAYNLYLNNKFSLCKK